MSYLKTLFLGIVMVFSTVSSYAADSSSTINVYKSAACGCCKEWVYHLEENGFKVISHDVSDLETYKKRANLPYDLGSCHTAFVDGYAVEGHVPATDIKKMLTEKPDIRGIAVPGMPMGSPGMEYGNRKDPYQTISYTRDGNKSVYASH
ncbi:DUF411 domain-containing protein [Endozoicomonas sp. Mp262]|uniref:DUF411 domain-containing protein n=1 Tax=Endozoicomonas sp. Mp262 TaxID=2919499 RepID=UPI0021DF8242